MAEMVLGKTKRRKPLDALILALLMTGLGQIYCGRIFKGLLLLLLSSIFGGMALVGLSFAGSGVAAVVTTASILAGLAVWLIAAIDAWYAARYTSEGYTLKDYNRWYVYLVLLLLFMPATLDAAMNVKANLAQAFRMASWSMYPALAYGDRVIANKVVYRASDPQVGDVVVFMNPENRRQNYIKRIVAMAGDTVEMKGGRLYVNGQLLQTTELGKSTINTPSGQVKGQAFLEHNGKAEYKVFLGEGKEVRAREDFEEIKVPPYCCFVLGDNRNMSHDSRDFGPIPLAAIKARVGYLYWPWAHRATLGQ